jgi:predicted DNA-binding antitoxin AbrB/MazE fold protein
MSEPITVEAVYENGVLRPVQPLQLREGEKVRLVVYTPAGWVKRTYGMLGWTGSHEDLERLLDEDDLYGTPEDWLPHSRKGDGA